LVQRVNHFERPCRIEESGFLRRLRRLRVSTEGSPRLLEPLSEWGN